MPGDLFNTREVAAYLGIHEKQVYGLVGAGKLPATKVTGKWVFPRRLVDEWLESDARARLAPVGRGRTRLPGVILAAGSNDPMLDILQSLLRRARPEMCVFTANLGSTEGLRALNAGRADLAWSHLHDPVTGEYNVPYLKTLLPDIRPVVVNLFHRELGIVTAPGNPRGIRGFADFGRDDVVIVNRQAGSGTRLCLDAHLEALGIPGETVRGYDAEAVTHAEAGLAVLAGEADAGLATGSIARLLGLFFIPVTRERFDMVLDRETYFDPVFQGMIETIVASPFRRQVERIGHYDISSTGRVMHSIN
jgi:putative molybdopterin biosynthesis protein